MPALDQARFLRAQTPGAPERTPLHIRLPDLDPIHYVPYVNGHGIIGTIGRVVLGYGVGQALQFGAKKLRRRDEQPLAGDTARLLYHHVCKRRDCPSASPTEVWSVRPLDVCPVCGRHWQTVQRWCVVTPMKSSRL